MTDQQFAYLYKQARRHFRQHGWPVMSRTEFKQYLGLMFGGNLPDIPVDIAMNYIYQQTDQLLEEMKSKTALDREILEQFVNLEE